MKKVLKVDAKAEFTQQADLVGSHPISNFTVVMALITMHIFPKLDYQH